MTSEGIISMNYVFRGRTKAAASTSKLYFSTLAWKNKGRYKKPVTIDGIFTYVSSKATVNQLFKQIDNPNPTRSQIICVILNINHISTININFQLFNAESIKFTQAFCDQQAFVSS
jgi:hypothetical protein